MCLFLMLWFLRIADVENKGIGIIPFYTYLLQAKILYNTALKGRMSLPSLLKPPEVES